MQLSMQHGYNYQAICAKWTPGSAVVAVGVDVA